MYKLCPTDLFIYLEEHSIDRTSSTTKQSRRSDARFIVVGGGELLYLRRNVRISDTAHRCQIVCCVKLRDCVSVACPQDNNRDRILPKVAAWSKLETF